MSGDGSRTDTLHAWYYFFLRIITRGTIALWMKMSGDGSRTVE